MTYPPDFTTGQLVTAADMNGLWDVLARTDYLVSAQSISNGSLTTIIWSASDLETGMSMTRVSGVYTVNEAGFWRVSAQITFAGNTTGRREVEIQKGSTIIAKTRQQTVQAGDHHIQVASPVVSLLSTDTIKIQVLQSSGGALDVRGGLTSTWVSFEWVGA